MGYKNPVWHNGMAPSINDDRLNDLCYTVERLDFADGRVVVGQKEGETLGEAATSEGVNTVASGDKSHAEGNTTTSEGSSSHAEGWNTTAIGLYSHAEGSGYASLTITVAGPINAGATTYTTNAGESDRLDVGDVVKAKISNNAAFTLASAKITSKTETTVTVSESLNPDTAITSSGTLNIYRIEGVAFETNSHSEGLRTIASGRSSHSEGENTMASGSRAHAEGNVTSATGSNSHSEGWSTLASASCSHAEGYKTEASGKFSHAEGQSTESSGDSSHSEGWDTVASGDFSHAEGVGTVASGINSHAEGADCSANGENSHAEGASTIANGVSQHVFGKSNIADTTSVEIVGWGANTSNRKNIRTLDQSGNMTIAGTLTQSSDAKLKTVEGEIPDVSEIHAVRFRWNDVNGQHDDLEHVGYIAQDVEMVAPFMVKEDSNGYKALDYIAFLCAKMELLERRVKELEEKKE